MVEHIITNVELKEFLYDFAQKSETVILEEGKEKDEIFTIAKTKGIELKGNRDLAGFKCIYAFADKPNLNGIRLPKKALLKALPTMIGKPVDIDHQRNFCVGYYIDYRFVEKDNKLIAYGIFYKSNFADEWEHAKKLFKAGKLTTSFEIWTAKDKRKKLDDGTIELTEQEIAGGAILFKTKPAFEEAVVLELAKQHSESSKELVFASAKYKGKEDELIVYKSNETVVVKEPEKKEEINHPQPSPYQKIKCSNCGEEIEININNMLPRPKCPKCFAILDQTGKMVYPPQIKDFKISCPSCKIDNWLILARVENSVDVKCNSCAKEYKFIFTLGDEKILEEKFKVIYLGSVGCLQCGKTLDYAGISTIKEKTLKCNRCGLTHTYNIADSDRYKKVGKIEEIKAVQLEKSSEEGGNKKMDYTVELTKFHRYINIDNFDEIEKASIDEEYEQDFEKAEQAKKLTYEERQGFSDDDFAVVVKVKNKKTGKMRKIRKYPIHDEAHVRNALARIAQPKAQETLKGFGISIEGVKAKILRRAKKLGMEDLLERHQEKSAVEPEEKKVETSSVELETLKIKNGKYIVGIKKLANKVKENRKEKEILKKQIAFYKANYKELAKRREELGEVADDLSDEEILNDEKITKARVEKANKENTAPETSHDKNSGVGNDWASTMGKEIQKKSVYNVDEMK